MSSSGKQPGLAAVDKRASGTLSAHCSFSVHGVPDQPAQEILQAHVESQVTNVFSYRSATPSDRHAHSAVGVRRARLLCGTPTRPPPVL